MAGSQECLGFSHASQKEKHVPWQPILLLKLLSMCGHQVLEAILGSMVLSDEQRISIQVATTGQHRNPNWHLF